MLLAIYGVAEWRMNHPECPPANIICMSQCNSVVFHLQHRGNPIKADHCRILNYSCCYLGVVCLWCVEITGSSVFHKSHSQLHNIKLLLYTPNLDYYNIEVNRFYNGNCWQKPLYNFHKPSELNMVFLFQQKLIFRLKYALKKLLVHNHQTASLSRQYFQSLNE